MPRASNGALGSREQGNLASSLRYGAKLLDRPGSWVFPGHLWELTAVYRRAYHQERTRLSQLENNQQGTARLREEPMRKEYDFSRAKRGPVVPVPPGKTKEA